MPTRVLIVDDDVELTGLLRELLEPEGYAVEAHGTGRGAAERATGGGYALVILDVMLPELNGFEILKLIRRSSGVPVILLTARGDDVDRIVGLEIGADDYLPKPFNPRELLARMRAVLRRAQGPGSDADKTVLTVDDLVLDPGARSVTRGGAAIELTTVEFDMLRVLLAAAGQVVAREEISQRVLGRPFDPLDRAVDMHISKLRRKLGEQATGEERIKTVRGVGYIYALPSGRP
jgi:two-component system response regulator CpxR